LPQTHLASPAQKRRPRRAAAGPTRVTIAWTAATDDGEFQRAQTELELEAGVEAAANRNWACPGSFDWNWVEAISSARCEEVVLTARIGGDASAKHLVLGLAELLTFKLSPSQPLIRVRFLPTAPAARTGSQV
jgi:hypothetical protein